MKVKVQVTELSHDDLVNLFSTALFTNSYLDAEIPEAFKQYETEEYWEDNLANVILNGGWVDFVDMCSEEKKGDWEPYKRGHFIKAEWQEFEVDPRVATQGEWGHIVYSISLKNILEGMSTERGYELAKELFTDEDGDLLTAYNLMQVIMFGEEIYG